MLTYSFENIGSESLYEYLYRRIKEDILSKKLQVGDRLPSKRSFAKHLNISVITVESAYSQLQVEGYIYSIPKKGYFVSDLDQNEFVHKTRHSQTVLEQDKKEPYFVDFASNTIHPDNFPFPTWTKLMREIIAHEPGENLLTSAPAGGITALKHAISEHLYEFRGMSVSPEQIIIGAGTEYIYNLLIQLLGHNNLFAVENPGYQKISKVYEKNAVSCCHIPMDKDGISVKELQKSQADIVHLSPSHHFPTGIVVPISRRYDLLSWASQRENRYIIEDDYDCEFRLYGKPIPTLQSIDVMEKVIYMNTFTKSLAPSFRIAYMVLPKHLLHIFQHELSFYSCTVSNIEQYTLAAFIEQGYFEKHINRMRIYYRTKRDKLIKLLKNSTLAPFITLSEEDSGLHFLMELKTERTDEELIERARIQGIRIRCLSQFYYKDTPRKEHILIVSYAGIEETKMEEAVHRLECLL